jgi:nucleotide-binding universal stress UspA family protein
MQKDLIIKRILIPFDFSETSALSLDHAVHMAKTAGAELYLLHIIETSTFPSSIAHAFSGFEKKVEEASNEKLKELSDELSTKHGIKVHTITEVGKIYKRIVHTAKQAHIDLVLMGTHGASGSSYIIGSNTTRVVQESHCPVISFQTHSTKLGFTNIALPIDDSPESRQKVNFAMEIAKLFNAKITVIGLNRNGNEDYQRKFRIKIEQVEDFLGQHGVQTDTIYQQGEDLAKNTLAAATEINADLLVIMTEQEPSITGMLMGTYATKIINGSKIPVMTVRPAEIDPDRITVTF